MLGSVQDAEDALQDSLLRAWRGLPRFEERSSLRNWLFRIATNTCLNVIERRPPRHLPIGYGKAGDPFASEEVPLVESVWIDPYPDAQLGVADGFAAPAARYERRESLELAFVAALQLLPAGQRAVLIMREVLGFSAREVAEALDTSVASVNSSLQRARKALAGQLPEQSQQEARRALGEPELEGLVRRYADAMERADIDAVVAMLTEDATWSMPPWSSWFDGPDAIFAFLRDHALNGDTWRHVATSANGQAAVGCYIHERRAAVLCPGRHRRADDPRRPHRDGDRVRDAGDLPALRRCPSRCRCAATKRPDQPSSRRVSITRVPPGACSILASCMTARMI